MQLGARWRRGETPHRSVPEQLFPLIELEDSAHPFADSWTLTWLEGRPRAMLDHLVVVTIDVDGRACVERQFTDNTGDADSGHNADDDDWLK